MSTRDSTFRVIVPSIVAVVALTAGATGSEVGDAVDLGRYRWENRPLLVFAPDRTDPLFQALHESLAERGADLEDRDMVVFEVLESGLSTEDGEPLDPATARLLRQRFRVPGGGFCVVLVGKDGGVKLDRRNRTGLDEIFALIDSMPMRRQEMRHDKP